MKRRKDEIGRGRDESEEDEGVGAGGGSCLKAHFRWINSRTEREQKQRAEGLKRIITHLDKKRRDPFTSGRAKSTQQTWRTERAKMEWEVSGKQRKLRKEQKERRVSHIIGCIISACHFLFLYEQKQHTARSGALPRPEWGFVVTLLGSPAFQKK